MAENVGFVEKTALHFELGFACLVAQDDLVQVYRYLPLLESIKNIRILYFNLIALKITYPLPITEVKNHPRFIFRVTYFVTVFQRS